MKKIIAVLLIPIAVYFIWTGIRDITKVKAKADVINWTDDNGESAVGRMNIVTWQGNVWWLGSQGNDGTYTIGLQVIRDDNGNWINKGIIVIKNGLDGSFDDNFQYNLDFTESLTSSMAVNGITITGTINSGASENWRNVTRATFTKQTKDWITMNFYVNEILIGNGSLQKQGTNDTGQWMSVTSFAYNTKLIDLDSLNYMRNQDYNKGYRAAANARLENLTPWGQITLGVDELFNIPLFGNVTIGSVMRIGLGAVMVGIIMKLFLGG